MFEYTRREVAGPENDIAFMSTRLSSTICFLAGFSLAACQPGDHGPQESESRLVFELRGEVATARLSELSGLEAVSGPLLVAHNDDGKPDLFVFDESGHLVVRYRLKGARNRDWEDLTQMSINGRTLLVAGDIGDNLGRYPSARLYFFELPQLDALDSDRSGGVVELDLAHTIGVTFPDGPRDCEAMAFDPSSGNILFITKRDRPPRLYGLNAAEALKQSKMELRFLGTVPRLRPATKGDALVFGLNTQWISQPTGLDIDASGRLAAIISYRSLFLFERKENETWPDAFFGAPREFLGPRYLDEEAITFGPDMKSLYISSEGSPAPIIYVRLPESEPSAQ